MVLNKMAKGRRFLSRLALPGEGAQFALPVLTGEIKSTAVKLFPLSSKLLLFAKLDDCIENNDI